MTRAKDISKILTDADISGNIDVDGVTNLDVVDIDGALTQDGGAVFNEASADVDFRVESNGNANMLVVNGGTDRIGIGTDSPSGNLHIFNSDASITASADADDLILENNGACGITIGSATNSTGSIRFADSGGTHLGMLYYSHITNEMRFYTASSERMRIDSSGNLAIGHTSTTGSKLAICDGANSQIQFFPEISTDTNLTQHYDITASAYINAETRAASHIFKTGTTERMRIDSSGRVLMGSTSTVFDTDQVLHISGTQGCNMRATVESVGGSVLNLQRSDTTEGDFLRLINSSNAETGQIKVNSSGTTVFENVSDYRLKDNIKDWTVDAIAKVKQIKIRTFDWKDQTAQTNGKDVIGVIAHELQEVYSYCVSGEKDGYGEDVDKDGNKKPMYQGVDYGKLTPLLTKALQEQQATIEALTARITALEGA